MEIVLNLYLKINPKRINIWRIIEKDVETQGFEILESMDFFLSFFHGKKWKCKISKIIMLNMFIQICLKFKLFIAIALVKIFCSLSFQRKVCTFLEKTIELNVKFDIENEKISQNE